MKSVLFPGSFDPVTQGHLDLIRRASLLFDRVYAVILQNPEKTCMFSTEQRKEMLRAACAALPNVTVDAYMGYTADYAKENGISAILRGIRDDADYAYEKKMADFNLQRGGVDTVFLPAKEAFSAVSSTAVREGLSENRDISALVPPEILKFLC